MSENSSKKDVEAEAMDDKNISKKRLDIRWKGLFKSVLFFAILIGLLAVLSKVYKKKIYSDMDCVSYRYTNVVTANLEKENSYDVLISGDSISYSGISPLDMWEQQGITGRLVSSPGQEIQETYGVIEEIFKKQSPKVVVIESNVIFKNGGYFGNSQRAVRETINECFPSIKYHNSIWKNVVYKKKNNNKYYKGYEMVKQKTQVKINVEDYMKKTDKAATINPVNKLYLNKIVNLCKEKGCKVCILTLPTRVRPSGSTASKYEEYNCLKKYTEEKDIEMINMNKMCLDNEMTINWEECCGDDIKKVSELGEHLNITGAKIASDALGKFLLQTYSLKDHRSEEAYKDWSDEFKKFDDTRKKVSKNMVVTDKETVQKKENNSSK